ncbi:acyl-CoA dehydrogenase family protein [Streptacidiphilus rugosus]|uniref:acyl-CoA dehydrogenase family protein n=1 Tax=Streptacidiphilus rugosus TaxID=405783 RepID=UPI00055CA53D|nr:acyl-CoA dehydrogenase family protein [Streptacidiphilus rugosus]
MRRAHLTPEHHAFRAEAKAFIAAEITPYYTRWEREGTVDRALWRKAGAAGLLGLDVSRTWGGRGLTDLRYHFLLGTELVRAGVAGVGIALHNDVVAPYLTALTDTAQRRRWLPGFCAGELLVAIAMSEPDCGSDLRAMRTTAVRDRSHYVLRGTKTFVSNGSHADLIVVAAVTDRARVPRGGGVSLFVVEGGTPGLRRGRPMRTLGSALTDVVEIGLDDVRVPADHLLGQEGHGLGQLTGNLARERLSIAVAAVAGAEAVFADTLERRAAARSGARHGGEDPQAARFVLAELATELEVARAYLDRCVLDQVEGVHTVASGAVAAAQAKWWTTDLQRRVVDRCLELLAADGPDQDSRAARACLDTRMMPIYGGTNEVMKELVGRSLGR